MRILDSDEVMMEFEEYSPKILTKALVGSEAS
jgi:hypothetical protein